MVKDILENPFRILGLQADASYRDAQMAMREIQSANKLNRVYKGEWSSGRRLGTIRQTTPALNAAMTILEDPVQRIQARILWYRTNPDAFISKLIDSKKHDLAFKHDLALNAVLNAAYDDLHHYSTELWHKAVARWMDSLHNPAFWELLVKEEEQALFPKGISTEEMAQIRLNPPSLPLMFWKESAKEYLQNKDVGGFLRLNNLARTSPLTDLWEKFASNNIVNSYQVRISNAAQEMRNILEKVEGNNEAEINKFKKQNKKAVDAAAVILVRNMKPDVILFNELPQTNKSLRNWSKEQLATSLYHVSNAYTWALEWEQSNYLLQEASSWVIPGSALEIQIKNALEERNMRHDFQSRPKKKKPEPVPQIGSVGYKGTIYVSNMSQEGRVAFYKVEADAVKGVGALKAQNLKNNNLAKASIKMGADYFKTKKSIICGNISLDQYDFIIRVTEVGDNGSPTQLALATFISLCSTILRKPIKDQLILVGAMDSSGVIKPAENIPHSLKLWGDIGAKKVLLPIESASRIARTFPEYLSNYTLISYDDPIDAFYKAIKKN